MFKASEIHRLMSLTESYFTEVKGITLDELLKMEQSTMIKVVRSMYALKDKPILTKRVFEGIAMIKWMESHGGKVRNQELKALEKVFPFRDVQAAMSSALQAYNKKIGYDPISMTQKKESVEERMMSGAAGNVNFKPRGAGQSTKKPMKADDEKKIAILRAQLLNTPLNQKQKVMDQIQAIQSKYESKEILESTKERKADSKANKGLEYVVSSVGSKKYMRIVHKPSDKIIWQATAAPIKSTFDLVDLAEKMLKGMDWDVPESELDLKKAEKIVREFAAKVGIAKDGPDKGKIVVKESESEFKDQFTESLSLELTSGEKETIDLVAKKLKKSGIKFLVKAIDPRKITTGSLSGKNVDVFVKPLAGDSIYKILVSKDDYDQAMQVMRSTPVKESKGKWAQLAESHFQMEGGPGSGGQYLTRKFKMPMSPFISVGTRKGILKNMPFDLEDVPLSKITHVAQAKFVPQKVKNLCKNPDVITKYPVCLLKIPSQDCYHVMDGHHRFLAAQKLGIENLPAKVWLKYEEEPAPVETPSEPAAEPEMGEGEPLPLDQAPGDQNPDNPMDMVPAEAMPLPEPEAAPEPNPATLVPDDSANAMSEIPSDPDPTAPDPAIVGLPADHDHYEVMCEKCQKVTESCGCMAEEKAKRTTVCEACKANSFLAPTLEAALKSIASHGHALARLHEGARKSGSAHIATDPLRTKHHAAKKRLDDLEKKWKALVAKGESGDEVANIRTQKAKAEKEVSDLWAQIKKRAAKNK